jgi:hypothetical protein
VKLVADAQAIAPTEGQAVQAIPVLTNAMRPTPRDPYIFDRFWQMGYALLLTGHYPKAVTWTERSQAAWPDAPARNRSVRIR